MPAETPRDRSRRKFVFGVLEQMSNILGAMSASVLVVGLILPAIAVLGGRGEVARATFVQVATLVLGFALAAAVAAAILRGLARRIDDDAAPLRVWRRVRDDDLLTGGN